MPVREMKVDDLSEVLGIQEALAFQDWNERQFRAEIAAGYALCVVYEASDTPEAPFNAGDAPSKTGEKHSSPGCSPFNAQNAALDEDGGQSSTRRQYAGILGYAVFHLMGPDSELLSIATRSEAQRQGIGNDLLCAGLERLDFSAGDKMFLEVREGNEKARRFYEKHGFTAYATRKKYYADGENAVLYQKLEQRSVT